MYTEKIRSFFDDFYENEKYRLPNFIPVGIGIGIYLYFSLYNEPNFYINILIFALALGSSIFIRSYKWITYIFLTISLGFFVSQLRTKLIDTPMLSKKISRPISIIATIEVCEKTEKGLMFIVNEVKALIKCAKKYQFRKLHLTWRGKKAQFSENDYKPGDRVMFRTILSPIHPQAFPGAYDFRKQQYFKEISARGFIIKQPKILKDNPKSSFQLLVEGLRHKINKKMEIFLSKDIAAVAKALTTGNKSGISKEIRSNFANSGTAHILAISGLHIGIIGFFVFWFFRTFLCCFTKISMFRDIKKIAAIISWVVVLFYLYISGCSVPSVRAFIMHTLIIIAILLNRVALTMRSVAIAATLIEIFSPEAILFPSFQMSFGAVIAIVAFYEHLWVYSGIFKTLFNAVATTIVATLPTSVFSVYVFNQLTLNSILANIISIPLMSFFIMPIAAIGLFFMLFDCARPFVLMMGYGVNLLMKISEHASKLPGSFFVMHTPTDAVLAILIFSGLLCTLVHHKILFLGVAGCMIGLILYFFQPIPDIFISPDGKAIGIRIDDAVCFNHLGYFRSAAAAWSKSVGCERRDKFNSSACNRHILQLDENTYLANIKNKKILITDDEDYEQDSDMSSIIRINNSSEFSELIYLPSGKRISNKDKKRPWN
jgi:competence protein ComEC